MTADFRAKFGQISRIFRRDISDITSVYIATGFSIFSVGPDDVRVISRNAISYLTVLESLRMLDATRDQASMASNLDNFWSIFAAFRQ